jgi:hypothetical protein
MAAFTVHEPPNPTIDRVDRADEIVFVRDGFSWALALIAPLWLVLRGEWLLLAIYLVLAIALTGLLSLLGAPQHWVSLAGFAFGFLFAFEASELRRWLLDLRGWREIAAVSGRNLDEAERRFFDAWLAGERFTAPKPYGHPDTGALAGWPETRAKGWLGRLRGA